MYIRLHSLRMYRQMYTAHKTEVSNRTLQAYWCNVIASVPVGERERERAVSYTHLDVYKRQGLGQC